MDREPSHDILKDAASLSFQIIYQAIEDAFCLTNTSAVTGMAKNHPKMIEHNNYCRKDAVRFLFSDELEDMCELASIYYYMPSPASLRRKYRDYEAGTVSINMRDIMRVINEKKEEVPESIDYDQIEVNLSALKRREGRKLF